MNVRRLVEVAIDATGAQRGERAFSESTRRMVASTRQLDEATDRTRAEVKELGEVADGTGARLSRLSTVAAGAGSALAAIGIASLIRESVQLYGAQEKALAQVEAAIRSTGGAAGYTTSELATMASGFEKLTTFGDEAILAMDSVLLTFTKIGREVFPEASQAILDMSARLGTDLKSQALQVGKALQDPIAGVSALAEAGVSFSKDQKAFIASLVETGRVVEAQKIILAELTTEFGGSAEAARNTAAGAMEALGGTVGNLKEAIGAGLAPVIQDLTERLNVWLETNAPLAQEIGEGLGTALRIAADAAVFLAQHIDLIVAALAGYAAMQAVFLFVELAGAIKTATTAMLGLNLAIRANPLGALATVIGLIVSGLALWALNSDEATEATSRQNGVLEENRRLLEQINGLQGQVSARNVEDLRRSLLNLEGELQKVESDLRSLERPEGLRDGGGLANYWNELTGAVTGYYQEQAKLIEEQGRLFYRVESTREALKKAEEQQKANAAADAARKAAMEKLQAEMASYSGGVQKTSKEEDGRRKRVDALREALGLMLDKQNDGLRVIRDEAEETAKAKAVAEAYLAIRKADVELTPKEREELEQLAKAIGDVAEQREREASAKERAASVRDLFSSLESERIALEQEIEALKGGPEALRAYAAEKEFLRIVTERHIPIIDLSTMGFTAEAQAIWNQVNAIIRLREERDRLAANPPPQTIPGFETGEAAVDLYSTAPARQEVQQLSAEWQAFERTAEDGFLEMLYVIAGESDATFEEIVEGMLRQWVDLLAQMAARWAAQKFVAAISGGGGGGSGATGAAVSAGAGYAGTAAAGGAGGLSAGAVGALASVAVIAAIYFLVDNYIQRKRAQKFSNGAEFDVEDGRYTGRYFSRAEEGVFNAFSELIDSIEQAAGGLIRDLPKIGVKIRADGKRFAVTVGDSYLGTFRSINEAITSALQVAFTQGNLGSLAPEIQQVLQRKWDSPEELLRAVQTVQQALDTASGLSEIEVDMRGFEVWIKTTRQAFLEAGLNIQNATRLALAAGAERLAGWRRQITGEQQTAQEELEERKRQAAVYNAQLILLKVKLEAERAAVMTEGTLTRARLGLFNADISAQEDFIRGKARLFDVENEQYAEYLNSRGQIDDAERLRRQSYLQAIDAALANLPGAIDIGSLRPISGGGGGGGRRQQREDLMEEIERLRRETLSQFGQELASIIEQYDELLERARRLGEGEADLQDLREQAIRRQLDTIRDQVGDVLGGRNDFERSVDEIRDRYDALREANEEALRQTGELAVARWKLNAAERAELAALQARLDQDIASFGNSPTLEIDAIRRQAEELRRNIAALGLTAEEAAARIEAVNAGERARLQQIEFGVLDRLFGYLTESGQFEEQRLELARQKVELEFAILRAQLEALGVFAEYADIFNAALDAARRQASAPPPRQIDSANIGSGIDERQRDLERLEQLLRGWRDLGLSPLERQLRDLNEAFQEAVELAGRTGRSVREVQEAYAIALQAFWDQALQPLRDFAEGLNLSDLSTLTPEERLAEAQRQLDDAVARARGGDLSAYADLPRLMQQLLQEGRSYYASSDEYTDLFEMVEALLAEFGAGPGGLRPPGGENVALFPPVAPRGGRQALDIPGMSAASRAAGMGQLEAIALEVQGLRRDLRERLGAVAMNTERAAIAGETTANVAARGLENVRRSVNDLDVKPKPKRAAGGGA